MFKLFCQAVIAAALCVTQTAHAHPTSVPHTHAVNGTVWIGHPPPSVAGGYNSYGGYGRYNGSPYNMRPNWSSYRHPGTVYLSLWTRQSWVVHQYGMYSMYGPPTPPKIGWCKWDHKVRFGEEACEYGHKVKKYRKKWAWIKEDPPVQKETPAAD